MFSSKRVIILFFGLFCYGSSLTQDSYCNLDDDDCMEEASKRLFADLIAGIPSLGIESSDPLHQDGVQTILPNLNYTFTDANLIGMKRCNIQSIMPKLKESSLIAYFVCPRLTQESKYDIIGNIGPLRIEGKGDCKIVHNDYHIAIYSDLDKTKDKEDSAHISIQNFSLGLDARGGIIYEWKNIFDGDKEKSDAVHKYTNEHWKEMNVIIQEPTMYAFMSKFVDNINKYFKKVPLVKLFRKTV